MGFWRNFWNNLKKLGAEKPEEEKIVPYQVQKWEDYRHYNPLDIVVSKLSVLANDEATIEVDSDSTLAEPLKVLCEDLESKRYEICEMMLGNGGCYMTYATDDNGKPYHRIVRQESVSVYKIVADTIYEAAIIIDTKIVKGMTYRLIRHHLLEDDGTLVVYYYTTDTTGNNVYLEDWAEYKDKGVKFINANNIGIGYFKCPQSSRGLEEFFGVPLNFGCQELEEQIKTDRQALITEMKNAESKLFADESILMAKESSDPRGGGKRYDLPENIYTIRKKMGVDGSLIDTFNPTTRFADYKSKLDLSCQEYEDQIGLNRGFLTDAEYTSGATATEIRTANVKTISMIKKVQMTMYNGILDTLTADCVFLNVSKDLWDLKVDWYNPFEDEESQYQRILNAAKDGYAEDVDVIKWVFPNLSLEEIEEKIARIKLSKQPTQLPLLTNKE